MDSMARTAKPDTHPDAPPTLPVAEHHQKNSVANGQHKDAYGRRVAKSSGKFQGRVPQAEVDKRVFAVKLMLAQGMFKSDIKEALRTHYGVTSARQHEEYISRAKAELAEDRRRPVDELADESYAFYMAIASDVSQTAIARLKARQRADEIAGIGFARVKHEHEHVHAHAHAHAHKPAAGPMTRDEFYRSLPVEVRAKVIETERLIESAMRGTGGDR